MTSFCGNCGAPHGPADQFCHTCGSSLAPRTTTTTSAPEESLVPPAASAAALADLPVLIRRLPPALVIGGVVAFLLIVAASAVVVTALLGRGGSEDPGGPGGEGGGNPGTLQTVDVRNISAQVPNAWGLLQRDPDVIAALERPGNVLWLRSGRVGEALSLDGLQQLLLDRSAEQAPDARVCGGPETAAVPGLSLEGRYFAVCSTRVPQGGGRAVRFADAYYIAVDASGQSIFVVQLTASPELLDGFAATVRSLPPPEWKLAAE